jgi:DNA-directed RNA polymerase specialized sigma24 family protein
VDIAKAIWHEIDWDSVYKRLSAFAFRLAKEMPSVFDGISADDLVAETFLAYYTGAGGLKWNPLQGSLEKYLCGVMKNKFLMHARRNQHYAGSLDDRAHAEWANPVSSNGSVSDTFEERIKLVVRGDKQLEEFVEAAKELESDGKINQQLSRILNTTTTDVINRRKRLVRRLDRAGMQAR